MARLLIHASNIHKGGGAILLSSLLQQIPDNLKVIVSLDIRMKIPEGMPECVSIEFVKPTVLARLLAEYRLAQISTIEDQVLCFGNLPPLFKVKGNVSVFLQNRYLVDKKCFLVRLPPRLALRLLAERIWLYLFKNRPDRYFVQTATMKRLTQDQLQVPVVEISFAPVSFTNDTFLAVDSKAIIFDFLYVASGEEHKNHKILLSAWKLLAREGQFPSLALTLDVDDDSELIKYIECESTVHGLCIHNLGRLPHHKLIDIYRECRALIYASDFESFGLPLIEAKIAGLATLAPELDYVRDVLDPEETFDPGSAISIARAVKRYMKVSASPLKIINADDFLSEIMGSDLA